MQKPTVPHPFYQGPFGAPQAQVGSARSQWLAFRSWVAPRTGKLRAGELSDLMGIHGALGTGHCWSPEPPLGRHLRPQTGCSPAKDVGGSTGKTTFSEDALDTHYVPGTVFDSAVLSNVTLKARKEKEINRDQRSSQATGSG